MSWRRLLLVVVCGILLGGCGSDSSEPDAPVDTRELISTAGCTPDETAERYPSLSGGTVQLATTGASPPYHFTEPPDREKLVGFDADFAEAWARCLGVEYEWQFYQEVPAMIAAVQSGRADAVHASLFYNPDRAKQIDFVIYMKTLTGSLVSKGNPEGLRSINDLCGKTDAQALGVVEVPLMKEQSEKCRRAGRPPVDLVVYKDNNVAIQAVVSGRADAFLGDAVLVDRIAKRFPDRVETAFKLDNNLNIGVGINKQEVELRQAILEAAKVMQENGTEERLVRKWRLDPQQIVPAFHPD